MSLLAPSRPTPPGPRRAGRSGVTLVLVALTVGAAIAVVVMLFGAPATAAAAAPQAPVTAPAPLSTRGVVVASAVCTDPGARDLVELRGVDGRPQKLPLDACGTQVGMIVPLTVAAGDPVAHLAGAGSPAGSVPQGSPMAERLAVTLGAVAALGAAALLVALGRERWARGRGPRPSGSSRSSGSSSRRPAGAAPGR